jgi:hypothetical protein
MVHQKSDDCPACVNIHKKQRFAILMPVIFCLTLAICLLRGVVDTAHAGTISLVETAHCDLLFSGIVAEGDAERLVNSIQNFETTETSKRRPKRVIEVTMPVGDLPRLCLDSPGGRYQEAVEFAKAVREKTGGVVTVVDDGAKCLSACALMFLTGLYKGPDGFHQIYRQLHAGGVLGFHAPFQPLDAPADEKTISRSYRAGVVAVAELLSFNDGLYPKSLLAEFLKVRSGAYYYIDEVLQLAAWNIDLIGYQRAKKITGDWFQNVCFHLALWPMLNRGGVALREVMQISDVNLYWSGNFDKVLPLNDLLLGSVVKYVREATEADGGCAVVVGTANRHLLLFGVPSWEADLNHKRLAGGSNRFGFLGRDVADLKLVSPDSFTPSFYMLPPRTKIKALWKKELSQRAVAISRDGVIVVPSNNSRPALKQFGSTPSLWTHNGSTMMLGSVGAERVISYYYPREGMRKVGVTPNTVLYRGRANGANFSGTAYTFSKRCGQRPYKVSGKFSAKRSRIVLRGRVPLVGKGCRVRSYRREVLVFDYIR